MALMHGTADTVVPMENGRRLHERCRLPFRPFWLDGYGHNDIPLETVCEYTERFLRFLDQRRRTAITGRAAGGIGGGAVSGGGEAGAWGSESYSGNEAPEQTFGHAVPGEFAVEGGANCAIS